MASLEAALLLVAIYFISLGKSQQCRYVTVPVCDENVSSTPVGATASKGDKGERGFSGKLGPRGETGSKGNAGEKGSKGNTAQVEELQEHLSVLINAMQSSLNQLLLPPNCASSSVVGYQQLRSGEEVYCDGGWMVFQRHYDGSVDFQRNWNDYKNGFGNFSTEFWLGLDKIHNLTRSRGCRLRVDMWSFDDDHAFAEYSDFSIESESDNYRIHIGGYSGTAGDCFTASDHSLDEMQFTTPDRDNDRGSKNCAVNTVHGRAGGWWYNNCAFCHLNSEWGRSTAQWHNNIWDSWKGSNEALKASVMKLRCD